MLSRQIRRRGELPNRPNTCTVCEYSYVGDETEATGHAYALNTVEATCVTYGYTEHVCANCSDKFVTDYIAALGHDYEDEIITAEDGKIGYTKHTCRRCDYSYLSDFVTSGDDGYIGEDEHTHAYIFQMENDEAGKRLLISYLCECGKAYDGEIVILFTDAEGIGTVLELAADGTADYSALNGTYRVTITDAEGELLADFELTNGEPEEHVHVYVFELEDNAEDRYFTFRYACACGEAYSGTLYISYTAENGEAGTLTASEEGIVDYSMLEGACHILIETETEVLYELGLPAVQPPEEPEEPDGGEGENRKRRTMARTNSRRFPMRGRAITNRTSPAMKTADRRRIKATPRRWRSCSYCSACWRRAALPYLLQRKERIRRNKNKLKEETE